MRLLAIAVAAMTLLSGCATDKQSDDPIEPTSTTSTTSTSTSTTATSTTSTSTGQPGENGTLAVTLELTPRAGRAPLDVGIHFDAQAKSASGASEDVSIQWWIVATYENGTTEVVAQNATLPADLNITVGAGNHTITGHARADAYGEASKDAGLAVTPVPVEEPAGPVFYDGAENGFALWTVTSNVYVNDVFSGTEQETPIPHPNEWEISSEGRSGSSFASGFPPNYRTRMTTTVEVPADASYAFSYWYRGGAEANGIDGLHVLLNDQEVAYHTGADSDWTQSSIAVAAGPLKITFRFDADPACDALTDLPEGCGAGDYVGYFIDDITVAQS